MSLDIGLAASKTAKPHPAASFSLDDDGYYWFCYPFFEDLYDRTGEMIDLYGWAWFAGAHLDELAATLVRIRAKANEMPEERQVCVGHSVAPHSSPHAPKPLFSSVRRDRLLHLLAQFEDLVAEARRDAKWVSCFGD